MFNKILLISLSFHILSISFIKAQDNDFGSSDFYYEYQIAELNKHTPLDLVYNEHVKKYIDIYTQQRKDELGKLIGLSDIYFPVFDAYLDQYDLPYELKFLTVVESGLNPFAKSKSAAIGLWQFKINAGKMFNLQIDSYIDDRYDVYQSTDAACRYLSYLYNTFNDWLLVLAAYNGGPGEIRKAIARAGGETNYWKIRPYLSHQAQNYVPAFIAAMYVFNNTQYHKIVKEIQPVNYTDTDTLNINYAISFDQICDAIAIADSDLVYLNPRYKQKYIPEGKGNTLVLPADKALEYLHMENRIRAKQIAEANYNDLVAAAGSTEGKTKVIHVVEKGEFFHKIALQHNCTIENIKAWNKLTSNTLYPGQKLIIWIDTKQENDSTLYAD